MIQKRCNWYREIMGCLMGMWWGYNVYIHNQFRLLVGAFSSFLIGTPYDQSDRHDGPPITSAYRWVEALEATSSWAVGTCTGIWCVLFYDVYTQFDVPCAYMQPLESDTRWYGIIMNHMYGCWNADSHRLFLCWWCSSLLKLAILVTQYDSTAT